MHGPVTPILSAVTRRPKAGSSPDVCIASLLSAANVVLGPGGEESIALRDSDNAVTLRFQGSRASTGPVDTIFLVSGMPEPGATAAAFTMLDTLARSPRRNVCRSRERLLLRDALVALDGRRVGASHRETAEVILGSKRAHEEWSSKGGWLKERMRRALARGEELCDGGYRRALQGACRFRR